MERRLRGRPARRQNAEPSMVPLGRRSTSTASTGRGTATRGRGRLLSDSVQTRRSSRPRSTTSAVSASTPPITKTTIKSPTPIKEILEDATSNFPTTLTTNTSTRAPNKLFNTSSVHSSYSSTTTQRTIEISSADNVDSETIVARLADRLRRSVSKSFSNLASTERTHTPSNTDAESRFSRSVSRSVYEDDKSSKATFSDQEDDPTITDGEEDKEEMTEYRSFNITQPVFSASNATNTCRNVPLPREFGGWIGISLLLTIVPGLIYYLQWSCSGVRNGCAFKRINLTALIDTQYLTKQVFKVEAVSAYLAFQLGIFVLVALLPGRRVHLTRETYKFNALAIGIVALLAGGVGEYLQYGVVNFILKHYLRFCIFGILNALTVALWCYIRVDTVKYNVLRQTLSNDYGRTGNFLVDYALGRQLNPKWMGLVDFKNVFYRASLASTMIFASAFIYKTLQLPELSEEVKSAGVLSVIGHYWHHTDYDGATLWSSVMLLFYITDAIIFEHHLASSFELQHEGFGALLLLRYATTPYILSSVAKYFCEHHVPISCCYAFCLAGTFLLIGVGIKRFSCAYKYKYRLNPLSPIFSNIETIHTYQGSRLLLSGLWGKLRQPNYLGDIIALIALGLPIFLRFVWPPVLSLGLLIALILHRATRANSRNLSRYHSSWTRYSALVPSYVLPKIY